MSDIEAIKAERNLFKGKYRSMLRLVIRTRGQLVHVTDHIEDEGDRRYFGSTNDADALRDLYDEMMSWVWDATDETNRMKSDPYADIRKQRATIAALKAENEGMRKILAGCDWYWPEDDTSSAACADGPWQIAENHDVKTGEVFGYSRGGVVETRYYGFLEAAEDADSDDQFEADEPTREAAEAKIAAELQRRAALIKQEA